MTRHQRCLSTIAGHTTDRPPRYMPSIACSVASAILGRPAHTGTSSLHYAEVAAWAKGEAAHQEFEEKFIQDLIAIQRAFDIDVLRMPWRMNRKPSVQVDEYTFIFGDPQGNHTVWAYSPVTCDFGEVKRVIVAEEPPKNESEASDENRASQPCPLPAGYSDLCRNFGEEFFVACVGGGIAVGHHEDDLIELIEEPEKVGRRLMNQARSAVALGQAISQNNYPKVLLGGGDLASMSGPIYSPEIFREVLLPAYKFAMKELNALGFHYVFRSDGNLWPLADMLFDQADCNGYGEVDRDAGMTVKKLRQKYPNLVLWGNVSSALLVEASPKEVTENSKIIIEESGGTRYFHGCSNAIMTGTPPANVEAMFAAAR